MEHSEYRNKINEINKKVVFVKDWESQRTLRKMQLTCQSVYIEMDKEMVNCRRTKKLTPKYLELEESLNELVKSFDHFHTMAILMS
jgi:hypothetical protein